ncbi:CRAL-TRIO domain-containing protein [Sordaria brevicollis]|uniref:CRAL-TRIO domain-containing protein n=1 Tax=Sordaria brevicollis TaxID=83679 RepID=A0AAE0PFU7_SORBR|nr:CRAL-TRIO domain-containing protein [Sordaria brevicollis]
MEVQNPVRSSLALGLTEQEQASFDALLELCRSRGYLDRPVGLSNEDVRDGLNDETTLLRFLRGRSFDVDGALKQFEEAQEIRSSVGATAAYDTISINDFENTKNMYPHWSGRRDKRGLPICIFDIASLDTATTTSYGKDRTSPDATRRIILCHDYLTRFVLPLCSAMRDRSDPDIPLTSAVYLVDIASFTLKQAWNVRAYAQDISKLLATCYPEVVARVYVLNASSYFSKIWSVLKKFIDPRTAEKLVIVQKEDVLPTLKETIDIENIPIQYGGRLDIKPVDFATQLCSAIKQAIKWERPLHEIPAGPIKYVVDEHGGRSIVAVGTTTAGKMRKELVARLP